MSLGVATQNGTPTQVGMPGFLLAFTVAAIILALRAPDALTTPQFWAEDGQILFTQQHTELLPQLLRPYAGYLLVILRGVAWFACWFPSVHAPLIYNMATVMLGAATVAALRRLPVPPQAFWAFLAALALTPTNIEVFGSLINAQWILQFYLLLPVWRFIAGESPRNSVIACVLAALVGLTGPFCLFAVAAAIAGRAFLVLASPAPRSWAQAIRTTPEMGVLLVCVIIQGSVALSAQQAIAVKLLPDWTALANTLAALQPHTLGFVALPHAVFLLVAAAAVLAIYRGTASLQHRAFLVASVCFVGSQLWTVAGKQAVLHGPLLEPGYSDRYFVLFKLFFWTWLVAGLLSVAAPFRRAAFPVVLSVLAAFAVISVDRLRRPPLPDLNWRAHAARIDRGEAVSAPINPGSTFDVHVAARNPR